MHRIRIVVAALLTVGVLWSASVSAAQTSETGPGQPDQSVTTVTISAPGDTELARTGPQDASAGLGLFGFAMVGFGVVTLVLSRRLLTSENYLR